VSCATRLTLIQWTTRTRTRTRQFAGRLSGRSMDGQTSEFWVPSLRWSLQYGRGLGVGGVSNLRAPGGPRRAMRKCRLSLGAVVARGGRYRSPGSIPVGLPTATLASTKVMPEPRAGMLYGAPAMRA
jgi:hypothetical protein